MENQRFKLRINAPNKADLPIIGLFSRCPIKGETVRIGDAYFSVREVIWDAAGSEAELVLGPWKEQ